MSDRLEDLDSKLDLVLERYKDYVLGSQGVYFSGSNLALDKKETKAALQSYIDSKIIEARIDEIRNVKAKYADISLDYPLNKRGKALSDYTFGRIKALNHRKDD